MKHEIENKDFEDRNDEKKFPFFLGAFFYTRTFPGYEILLK